MSDTDRRLCIAIGVANSIPRKNLNGAVNGARDIAQWAEALGYDTLLITDATGTAVTIGSLAKAVRDHLRGNGPNPDERIHRLIIYFAGHGILRDAYEGLWLLSDWRQSGKAVGMDALKRALYRYPIDHLCFISDACLSLPATIDQAEIQPDKLLDTGPVDRHKPWFDYFLATQEGTTTFMVPDPDPARDRCVFTGVLIEALWGTAQDAFSPMQPELVVGNSLSVHLKNEVPRVSARYSDPREPDVGATFPHGDDIYFDKSLNVAVPAPAPWPDPGTVRGMGAGRPAPGESEVLSRKFGAPRGGGGPDYPGVRDQLGQMARSRSISAAGATVGAGTVVALWHAPALIPTPITDGWSWPVAIGAPADLPHPGQTVLIEFDDGPIVSVPVQNGFQSRVARDRHGAGGLTVTSSEAGLASAPVLEALSRMERGGLRVEEAARLALELRPGKHDDPVLSVIAAYLYDSIGDVESIRRMAYYFVRERQPIPFDIALLGLLRGYRTPSGLIAMVPGVPARTAPDGLSRLPDWAYEATSEVQGVVGGDWPWMRQGWAMLQDPTDEELTLVTPELLAAGGFLTPARFTSFDRTGAEAVAAWLGLKRQSV